MALTANTIPSQITQLPTSWDAMLAFADGQTLTATGYLNTLNSGQLDLGGTAGVANPISAAGRTDAIWCLNISAIDVSSSDETYQFGLLGSNDVAFGNGNVELLAFHDFAAAASGRVFANKSGDPAESAHRYSVHQPDAGHRLPLSAGAGRSRRNDSVCHGFVVDLPRTDRGLIGALAMIAAAPTSTIDPREPS